MFQKCSKCGGDLNTGYVCISCRFHNIPIQETSGTTADESYFYHSQDCEIVKPTIKRFSQHDFETMPLKEYLNIAKCIEFETFGLMGIKWKKYITVYKDLANKDIVIEYI